MADGKLIEKEMLYKHCSKIILLYYSVYSTNSFFKI